MGQLIFKLVFPLTVISFVIFNKWWYVLPIDGPDTILTGFPLPYVCSGWHTSMSLQIFITELAIDLLIYFSFWLITVYGINRFLITINTHKILPIALLSLSGLLISGSILIGSNPNNIFYYKRNWDMVVMETGYKFIWQNQTRPNFSKYYPEMKND